MGWSQALPVDDLALHAERLVNYVGVYSEGDRVVDRRCRWLPTHHRSSSIGMCSVTLLGTHQRKAHSINPTTTHSFESYESSASISVYACSTIKLFAPKYIKSVHLMSWSGRLGRG
jgi:hypothetical protein